MERMSLNDENTMWKNGLYSLCYNITPYGNRRWVTSHPQKESLLYVKSNVQKYFFIGADNFKTKALYENRSKAHYDLWKSLVIVPWIRCLFIDRNYSVFLVLFDY